MRRILLLAATMALVFAGIALAASYKTGTYKAGTSKGDGVKLRIQHGSFSVSRISFRETCSNASDSFSDRFAFVKGSQAKLEGTINGKGRLHGQYKSSAGTVTVTGHVKGSTATVKGKESGSYTPPDSTASYDCSGSHTFTAKRVK
jgi:hypothetical protein